MEKTGRNVLSAIILTADEGQGGSAGSSSKLKSNEVTYTGKLIFSTGLKHQKSKRLFLWSDYLNTEKFSRKVSGEYKSPCECRGLQPGLSCSLGSAFGWDCLGSAS